MAEFNQNIASQQIEKATLAGFLKNPKKLLELIHIVADTDYLYPPHPTIFSILKDSVVNNKPVDPVIIAERVKNLGITFKANLNIYEYLNALSYIKISDKALEDSCRRLKTLSIRREIYDTCGQIRTSMTSAGDVSADQIITMADKLYNEKISAYDLTEKPEDLFENIIELIEDRANNPVSDTGLVTPYPSFNKLYGGLRNGQVYAWVSRPKHGKSTILEDIAFRVSMLNPGCKSLVLDTEMDTIDIKFRMASAITGIPTWWLETGNYKKNKELNAKFEAHKTELRAALNHVQHMKVAGKKTEDVISLIQRWYYGEVGRGNPAVVVYDYIKLTGESDGDKKEYQLIGEKVDKLKELHGLLGIPLLTACQLNRSAEGGTDDSSAIAQSDRLQWFAAQVGIFRRKTLEEKAEDGEEYGTHKYIELATRFQGKDSQGHSSDVKVVGEKGKVSYKTNFINYKVENFSVTELGTLKDMVNNKNVELNVQDKKMVEEILL
jgi:replicative DNA helicase